MAHRNSMRRTLRIARNSAGWIRPDRIDDDHGRQCRIGRQAEDRGQQQHRREAAAGPSRAMPLGLPPAARTTPVCEVPPPAGIAPSKRAADIGDACRDQFAIGIDRRIDRRKARPAAMLSVKLISAMPSAPGSSVLDQRGIGQRDARAVPAECIPRRRRPGRRGRGAEAAKMAPARTNSGAGECGCRRSSPISTST